MSENQIKPLFSVVCCPNCYELAAVVRLLPGTAFGVRSYKDGSVIWPMIVGSPLVARCASYNHLDWCENGVAACGPQHVQLTQAEYAAAFAGADWIEDPWDSEAFEQLRNLSR